MDNKRKKGHKDVSKHSILRNHSDKKSFFCHCGELCDFTSQLFNRVTYDLRGVISQYLDHSFKNELQYANVERAN